MRSIRAWCARLAGAFGGPRRDAELAAELESHVQLHVDDNVRAGMTPVEARRQALLQLGGLDATKERYRERRGVPLLDTLRQDVGYAARVLRKSPGFTATAVATLALGIGANTAIFSVANAVLLRPLPFPAADRLVMIFAVATQNGETHDVASYPDFQDWSCARSFDALGAFAGGNLTVAGGAGAAELVKGLRVSASLFKTLQIQPVLGRGFTPAEEQPGAPHVVVIGDGFWRRQYAGAADALGQTIRINDTPFAVVGVMPPGFRVALGGSVEDLYVPLQVDPNRNHGFLRVVGRLRAGVGLADAQAEMRVVTEALAVAYPKTNEHVRANVMRLGDAMAANARVGLVLLQGVVGLVLLIACTNVASLMLARGAARHRELAVRAALGAGRGRIARQLLTESVLLALAAGSLGLVLGTWTARGLAAMLAATFPVPRIEATATDGWVLTFALLLSIATAVLFGAGPAIFSAAPDVAGALRDGDRGTAHRAPRLRSALVVVEMALALVLLAGAGVLLKAFVSMRTTSPGFRADRVLAVRLWLPQPRFALAADRQRVYQDMLDRVRTAPGVRSAAFVADLPLDGDTDGLGFHIVGRPDPRPGVPFTAGFNVSTAGYFRTMRIPILAGRDFAEDDRAGTPAAVVVNESAARTFWPDRSPLGERIALPQEKDAPSADHESSTESSDDGAVFTVVGVVGDVRHEGLATPARPEFFVNAMQSPLDWPWGSLVVSTLGDPAALAPTVLDITRSVDRNVPVLRVNTMDDIVARSIAAPRVYATLLGAFAALALLLAAVGLYGLVSYSVSQRSHELGIRMALGAARGGITRLVLGQGLRLAVAGTVLGMAAAVAATRTLVSLIPSVTPNDPATLALVAVALLAIALLATYLPARRAARVDPMLALRAE